jgi:dTDP-4-amino-4,6-dideoxygalactose transaminase
MIPFNKPFLTGKETDYIREAVQSGKISGDGKFTGLCHDFFRRKYEFQKCLLTTSCTDALEMAALLLDVKEGDEIIVPSFTFVSSANPFVLRGGRIVFADSRADQPNIDEDSIEGLITARTKAIVPVHYAGVACNMDKIMSLASEYNVAVVEDAAQAIDARYKGKILGTFGTLGAISFHETKNVNCGEGGLLIINKDDLFLRAEIIREKGTNRSAFFRGEVAKYNWVDVGSSFLPSDLNAAYLYAQLQQIEKIQARRLELWQLYHEGLKDLQKDGFARLPFIPDYASNNGHIFYLLCNNETDRTCLIDRMKEAGIWSVFHYQSLHRSPFFEKSHDGRQLPNSDFYSSCLVRLPLFFELTEREVQFIIQTVRDFFYRKT